MNIESRAKFDQPPVFAKCEELGEAAVLADLQRAGVVFTSDQQKWMAWKWIYSKRLEREASQTRYLRATARWTFAVAAATFVVAAITAYASFHGK